MFFGMGRFLFIAVVLLGLSVSAGCNGSSHEHEHGHDHHEEEEIKRGPHGGRLLEDHGVTLELAMFEAGVPPRYRAYLSLNGKPIAPESYHMMVQLTRLGRAEQSVLFKPSGLFQESIQEIEEPHSFDVAVTVQYQDKDHTWRYPSYEGRTVIASDMAARSGIKSEAAGPRVIREILPVRGKILPSEHRIAHIVPRFPGVVREGRKHIGDTVEKGEVLAVIESNQSLQPFEVRSQIAGTIINGHLIVGEYVPENQWVFVVADLSEVWADFFVPIGQERVIHQGQVVEVSTGTAGETVTGMVSYVAPYVDERSQAQTVRVVLPNHEARFMPGMFVTGNLVTSEREAPVAVRQSGIQTFRDWQVVFFKQGDTYEIRPLTLGRTDGEWIEVLSGLSAGEQYVSANSYTVKADILKSGASHDH